MAAHKTTAAALKRKRLGEKKEIKLQIQQAPENKKMELRKQYIAVDAKYIMR